MVCGDDIEKSLRHIPKDSNSEKEAEKLRKFASDALSSCSSEIASFDAKSRKKANSFDGEEYTCELPGGGTGTWQWNGKSYVCQ